MVRALVLSASLAAATLPCGMSWHPPVRAVVQQQRGAIRRCYEDRLQVSAGLAGRVAVHFVVDGASGEVVYAELAAVDAGLADVGRCVLSVVRRLRLPMPDGGQIVVTYPFWFERAPRDRLHPPAALPPRRFATPTPLREIYGRSLLDGERRDAGGLILGERRTRVPAWLTSVRGPLLETARMR